MPKPREVTNKLHRMMDEGIIDPRAVADAALIYMSEADVREMAHNEELLWLYDETCEEE